MKHAWAWKPSRTPTSAKARSLSAWASQRFASVWLGLIEDHSFLESPVDQRVPVGTHAVELFRRIDQEVESRPDVVESGEVLEPLEERSGRGRHDDEIEVAVCVRLAAGNRPEHDDAERGAHVGRQAAAQPVEVLQDDVAHRGVILARGRRGGRRSGSRWWRPTRPSRGAYSGSASGFGGCRSPASAWGGARWPAMVAGGPGERASRAS